MPDHNETSTGFSLTRRVFLAGTVAISAAQSIPLTGAQDVAPATYGVLVREDGPGGGLVLFDASTGSRIFSFATDGRPEAVWATPTPGIAMVQTDKSLALVNCTDGSSLPIALPQTVATQILPRSIQFRGSRGVTKLLIGTPASAADTYIVDLATGERTSVMGLITATPPPVTLQNVALSPDDRHLIVWDGRRTWIIDLQTRVSRLLGTGQFSFSAGFVDDGSRIAYSQQLASGNTELRIQNVDGTSDELLFASGEILVSLPVPNRNALLLDERDDAGGFLAIYDMDTTGLNPLRADLLAYSGATNIVQFTPDGQFALVGIEGEAGRDWYRLKLDSTGGSALLFDDLADAEVRPGFDFDANWAVATLGADAGNDGAVIAVDLINGETTRLIEGITTDAAVSSVQVAPNGPGALVTIDSFTEFAVHFLDLEIGEDRTVDLMKGGGGIVAPDGDGFAVAFDLNTGGTATIVYDSAGQEIVTIQGKVLAWV